MTRITPNSISAIRWGIQNFDGSEFDIRMCKDNIPVIHHDTFLESGEEVAKLNLDELRKHDIETLEELLTDEGLVSTMAVNHQKILWLELKPDCKKHDRRTKAVDTQRMYAAIVDVIENKGKIPIEQINIFSFSVKLLIPFANDKRFRVYAIVPDIDECDSRSGFIRKILSLPRYFRRSLIYHGNKFKKLGFHGIMFPHQYVDGFRSLFHPSYEKVKQKLETDNFDLVTQAANLKIEKEYADIIRITDWAKDAPRSGDNRKNHIFIHRGCGIEPIDVE
ncbi:MAG: glycerophosphodiester phosphodiesterase [Candidatus Kariarchaeaceae archaeon]|jgi:hypothetical protein